MSSFLIICTITTITITTITITTITIITITTITIQNENMDVNLQVHIGSGNSKQ